MTSLEFNAQWLNIEKAFINKTTIPSNYIQLTKTSVSRNINISDWNSLVRQQKNIVSDVEVLKTSVRLFKDYLSTVEALDSTSLLRISDVAINYTEGTKLSTVDVMKSYVNEVVGSLAPSNNIGAEIVELDY